MYPTRNYLEYIKSSNNLIKRERERDNSIKNGQKI